MKKIALTKYTDFIVEETTTLLNIDSPTGYTEEAANWVKSEFEKLGFKATKTNKGLLPFPFSTIVTEVSNYSGVST